MSSDVARTDEEIIAGSSRISDDEVQDFWEKSWKTLGRAAKVDIGEHDTLIKMWAERVKISGHKLAIECLGGGLTYHDVDEMSDRFATYLINRPFLERGHCVALMLPNLSQYLVAIIGLLKAGMVGININPLYTKTEIENVLNDSKAQLLLTLANLASVPAGAHAPHLKEVIVTEVADCLPTTKRILINFMIRYVKRMVPKYRFDKRIIVSRFLSICDVDVSASREKLDSILATVKTEDTGLIQYTGGTTGVSKGAVLSHHNILINIRQSFYGLPQELVNIPKDYLKKPDASNAVALLPIPFYHIYGLCSGLLFNSLGAGSCVRTLPNPRDLKALMKLMGPDLVVFAAINTLLKAVVTQPDIGKLKLDNMITIAGGMATSPDVSRDWLAKTKSIILEGYGLTEAAPLLTISDFRSKQGGVAGYALPSTLIKLRDADGNDIPLGNGEKGEILAKGPQVMKGYFDNPEETARVFSDDGFLMTGDIGTIAADGLMRIVDRKKDMILVSGFNVYPHEIEDVTLETGLVVECAVVGVPSEKTGEQVILYAVPVEADLKAEDLKNKVSESLTNYKRPSHIVFIEELPKTPVGKILRREVRKLAEDKFA